jgi:enoyl-CoA hydratase
VVPQNDLLAAVTKKIEMILTRSPLAVAAAKKSINQAYDLETEAGLSNEADIFGALFTSADTKEGTTAFIEKRKPVFKGE